MLSACAITKITALMASEIDKHFLLSEEWKATERDVTARVYLLACFFASKAFHNYGQDPEDVLIKRFGHLLNKTLFGEDSIRILQGIRESNTTSVCGKILRNGEPAYCCRYRFRGRPHYIIQICFLGIVKLIQPVCCVWIVLNTVNTVDIIIRC